MLNYIWALLIAVGILMGFGRALETARTTTVSQVALKDGTSATLQLQTDFAAKAKALADAGNTLTKAAMNAASFRYEDEKTGKEKSGAVGLAFDFIGLMALWLGFMKIAEASGLVQLLASLMRPLFRFMFPTVPVDSPAAGLILMNYAANMLGLDNAATPLGIKAMKELQKLNGSPDTASNAQCMFLILNVSSLMLLPGTIIGYRASRGSADPAAFMVPMLIATTVGTLSAFIMAKVAEEFSPDTPQVDPAAAEPNNEVNA